MSLDPEAHAQQLTLLAMHRRTLAHLVEQAAQFGGEVFAPPSTANGIAEARSQIRRIKKHLRTNGAQVEDAPNDKAPRRRKPTHAHQAGDVVEGDKVGGDKVMGDKVLGDKRTVNTQGGDYAEGNIDKRQGNFIEQQIIQHAASLAPAPHQLRAPVGDFVGRAHEIDQLVLVLTKRGSAATVSGVRGMGGIGKTELAYAAAQRLAHQFPDAQLLVELRGASTTPLTPEQALQTVIRAFEREAKLPNDLAQLKAIYTSLLTGKRVLILADDAKDAAQVRPLLPPAGCALLVTSRNRFVLPGMAALDLGTLPPGDAEKLVLEICPRIGAYAPRLAQLCGYLALALRVSAGVLEVNDTRSVPSYLQQLDAERLKHLSDPDDSQADVEASLQLSYDALEPHARAALCQLSVFPASFDSEAAMAVVAVEGDRTEALELLRRHSLLEWEANVQRFSLHDLVRAFAAARLEDADAVRLRHARYYVRIAAHAQDDLYRQGNALAGLALFDQERAQIDAGWGWAMAHAGTRDADKLLLLYAIRLYAIAEIRYDRRRERIPQSEAQLAAAGRLGDRYNEGYALGNLGNAYSRLGEPHKAIAFYEQRLEIAREIGDRDGEAAVLGNLGNAYYYLGEPHKAIAFHEQHLDIARAIGYPKGEGLALGRLGNAYCYLGEPHKAIAFHEQHLDIARAIGYRRGEALAVSGLGDAYNKLGEYHKAVACYEQRLEIAREIGDRPSEAVALRGLGLACAGLGNVGKAIEYHQASLIIAREIGDRHGEATASWYLGLALEKEGDLARAAELMQVRVDYERKIGHPDAEKRAAEVDQLRQRLADGQGGVVTEEQGNL